ncbi:cyclase family protein [Geodermatophilus sp. SYSU D00697]
MAEAAEGTAGGDADEVLLRAMIDRLSNWGRWGPDDQRGTLNHIGPQEVLAARECIRTGEVVSMTLPYDSAGPQIGGIGRNNPQLFPLATGTDYLAGRQDPLPGSWGPARGMGYADDYLVTPTQVGTQWDSLAHVFFDGHMYNGRSAAEVDSHGARHNGIENYHGRLVTRGVLLDIPRLLGVDHLAEGTPITVEHLEAACARQRVEVRTGDALVVRSGFLEHRRKDWGDYGRGGDAPGLSLHTLPWLHEREVAAVATDTWGVEVRPNEIGFFQPFHIVGLTHMGLAIGEIFDLEAIARACARDGHSDFFFCADPLPLTGGIGSPVSALAVR